MKKSVLILLPLLFFSYAMAAVISNLTIPSNVPLNSVLTIFGNYVDTGNDTNVLCSFFLFDTADQNQVIIRLSDEYVMEDGSFFSPYQVTAPLFRRGYDYNAVVKCGGETASQLFYVGQKEDIALGITPDYLRNDLAFWLDPENSLTVVFFLFAILVSASVVYLVIGGF